MKRIVKGKVLTSILLLILVLNVFTIDVLAAINFGGSASAKYTLSNGHKIRIEYHNSKPHIHETDAKGRVIGSEDLDGEKHHSGQRGLSSSTKKILNGKTKTPVDKRAKKKADSYRSAWKKATNDSKKVKKPFLSKNKKSIERASKRGVVVVIIGGVVYVVVWLIKNFWWAFL